MLNKFFSLPRFVIFLVLSFLLIGITFFVLWNVPPSPKIKEIFLPMSSFLKEKN